MPNPIRKLPCGGRATRPFRQIIPYIQDLRSQEKPWLLTLLTVGTYHPFQVADEIADRYPDRRTATVALLDTAVGDLIKW